MDSLKRIVIFASGGGSNAESIVHYFKDKPVEITSFFTNNPNAGIIERASNHNIPCIQFNKEDFKKDIVLNLLKTINPDLIVLAGFLWLIPSNIINSFPNKIVNIHPALLPNYGGKGMHGMNVHNAVKDAGESESGPTIHYVNEKYDDGNIIAQGKCAIESTDTASDIAAKVLKLEHALYPKTIERLLFD